MIGELLSIIIDRSDIIKMFWSCISSPLKHLKLVLTFSGVLYIYLTRSVFFPRNPIALKQLPPFSQPTSHTTNLTKDFESILLTSVKSEYGDNEELFRNAIDHEWKKSYDVVIDSTARNRKLSDSEGEGEKIEDSTQPYIICNHNPSQDGHTRKSLVSNHFGNDLQILHNHDDKSCFVSSATHLTATTAPEELTVSPYTPGMKLHRGAVDYVLGNTTKLAGQIRMDLCDGVKEGGIEVSLYMFFGFREVGV